MKFIDKYPPLLYVDSVASTNSHLRDLSISDLVLNGTLLHSYTQTAGNGQQGNTWESEPFKNITSSAIFYPHHIEPRHQFILSIAAALGVYDFLSIYITEGLTIKWPNDIYVNDNKIAGILIENALSYKMIQSSIWGIGININQLFFSAEIPNPTSLKLETAIEHPLEDLLQILHRCIIERYNHMGDDQRKEYLTKLYRRNGFHEYEADGKIFSATFWGISSHGHLILRTHLGDIREFVIKEIKFISPS